MASLFVVKLRCWCVALSKIRGRLQLNNFTPHHHLHPWEWGRSLRNLRKKNGLHVIAFRKAATKTASKTTCVMNTFWGPHLNVSTLTNPSERSCSALHYNSGLHWGSNSGWAFSENKEIIIIMEDCWSSRIFHYIIIIARPWLMVGYVHCTVHYSVGRSSVFIVGLFVVRCSLHWASPISMQAIRFDCLQLDPHAHAHTPRGGEIFSKLRKPNLLPHFFSLFHQQLR